MPETKYRDILRVLKSRILRGTYKGRLPGDRVLAEELGVSPPTVKVAMMQLEVLGLVRRELRRGTFALSHEERRSMGISMSALMVLCGPGSASPWVMQVLFAFEDAAKKHGIDTIVIRRGDEKSEAMVDEVLAHLRNITCVGACMLSFVTDTAHALRLRQAEGPVVLADLDSGDPVLDSVVFDNEQAGRLIAEHLVGLGHRNVMWLDVAEPSYPRTVRWQVAQRIFDAAGGRMRYAGRPEHRSNSRACQEFLLSDDRPSAIVLGGAETCAEVAKLAGHLGFEVPRQLSLLSMSDFTPDNREWMFSGINYHPAEMGRLAFERMLKIKPGGEIQVDRVPASFVDLGSTAPPPG